MLYVSSDPVSRTADVYQSSFSFPLISIYPHVSSYFLNSFGQPGIATVLTD